MNPARVFVYGSLLPGGWNEGVAQAGGAYSVTPAWLDGARLLHFEPEGYPGLFRDDSGGRVYGAVYTYADADWPGALALLDELEGVDLNPPLYTRAWVEVGTPGGPICAWTYLYARPERLTEPGCAPVPSGRWLERST